MKSNKWEKVPSYEEQGTKKNRVFFWAITVGLFSFLAFGAPQIFPLEYSTGKDSVSDDDTQTEKPPADTFVVTHIKTPEPFKAIYMTQCVAGTPSFRDKLVALIDETELNSVVIDIKDFSGGIAFPTKNPALSRFVSDKCGAWDMKEFIGRLHDKGIYVVGRITVFQDPLYTSIHPEHAIKKASDPSVVWTDYKGLSFVDAGARLFWDYIVALSRESYEIGFDELNYDYIRFPSDGNMNDIFYPFSEEVVLADPAYGKAEVIEGFFEYLSAEVSSITSNEDMVGGATSDQRPVLSADLFGMTTTNPDDLNIGQVLERALPHFDYVMPMVYPSHYPTGFLNYQNPAAYPYEVIKYSMDEGLKKVAAYNATVASTSPLKIRPWLQDFNLGAIYTPERVRAQIRATYDAGLTSWALWDAGNTYTREALESASREGQE